MDSLQAGGCELGERQWPEGISGRVQRDRGSWPRERSMRIKDMNEDMRIGKDEKPCAGSNWRSATDGYQGIRRCACGCGRRRQTVAGGKEHGKSMEGNKVVAPGKNNAPGRKIWAVMHSKQGSTAGHPLTLHDQLIPYRQVVIHGRETVADMER
eukprot:1159839-Pelagomonas_calceolata.AAC.22